MLFKATHMLFNIHSLWLRDVEYLMAETCCFLSTDVIEIQQPNIKTTNQLNITADQAPPVSCWIRPCPSSYNMHKAIHKIIFAAKSFCKNPVQSPHTK